jgi:hypothetical protein
MGALNRVLDFIMLGEKFENWRQVPISVKVWQLSTRSVLPDGGARRYNIS